MQPWAQKVCVTHFLYFHLRINDFIHCVIKACSYDAVSCVWLWKIYMPCAANEKSIEIWVPPEQSWSDLASLEVVTDPDSRQCRSMHLEWGSDWDAGMRLDWWGWGEGKVGFVSLPSERCVAVWVSLTCQAYRLSMSISQIRVGDGKPCGRLGTECSCNLHPKDTQPPAVTYYRALAIKSLSSQLRIS